MLPLRFHRLSDAEKAEWQTKYDQIANKYEKDLKAWLEAAVSWQVYAALLAKQHH